MAMPQVIIQQKNGIWDRYFFIILAAVVGLMLIVLNALFLHWGIHGVELGDLGKLILGAAFGMPITAKLTAPQRLDENLSSPQPTASPQGAAELVRGEVPKP